MKYDCVIIGCGIAGMTASIYLKRANLNICIIDYDAPGGLLNKLKKIDNYPGYPSISGPELAFNIFSHVSSLDIPIKNARVLQVDNNTITLENETITAKKIIIATGKPPKRLKEDLLNISYCALCDGNLYKDKTIALIGTSKLAFEETIYLSSLCKEVNLICSDLSQIDDEMLESINKENIKLINEKLIKINSKDNIAYEIITENHTIPIDGIFAYLGFEPKSDFIKGIELNNGYIVVDKNMKTSNDNIYACGDIIYKDVYQLTTAASDGTIAAINVKKNID